MDENKSLALPVPSLKITHGGIKHNLPLLLDAIKKHVEEYKYIIYGGNSIQSAKRDRANLNSLAKSVNEARLNAEKEFMKPFYEVKDICKEIDIEIRAAIAITDIFIKNVEQAEREKKYKECELIFANEEFNLVDFKQILNERWLNKTISLAEVKKEIGELVSSIKTNLELIENLPNSKENNLKAYYLGNLNIADTLSYNIRLMEKKERLEAEKAEKELKLEAEAKKKQDLIETSKMGVILDTPELIIEKEKVFHGILNLRIHVSDDEADMILSFLQSKKIKYYNLDDER